MARRRDVEARTSISDLATRYIEFLWEEEERLVEHAKCLTAAVAIAEAAAVARNAEIYKESCRFERDHLERQRAFELAIDKGAAAAGTGFCFSSSSVGSSSSASY
jgi:hypothetical protein